MFLVPRPEPRWNSPSPAMSASLATKAFAPVARRSMSASGTLCQPGRFGGSTRRPRTMSIGPGAAIVIAVSFSRPRLRSISVAAQSTIRCGVPRSGVLVLKLLVRRPSERASATRTWVPPRSMPASIPNGRLSGQQLAAAQRLQDHRRRAGAVEGVEVQARDAGLEQLGALADAVLDAGLAYRLVVRGRVDGGGERGRQGRAGHRRHERQR